MNGLRFTTQVQERNILSNETCNHLRGIHCVNQKAAWSTPIKFKVRVMQPNAIGPVNLGGGAPTSAPAAPPAFDLEGLIAYWKLDEASGVRIDSHGANNLSDNNTVTQAAGKLGNAAKFTAANSEYLSHADNADLSMGAGVRMTITAWVYLDSRTGTEETIAGKRDIGSLEYSLRVDASNQFSFFVSSNGSTASVVTADASVLSTWYFVVAWYDGTNINLQINNGTVHSTAFSTDVFNGTSTFRIGNYDNGSPTEMWDGRIDSVSLWKRVLTPSERTAIYNAGDGLDYPFTTDLDIGAVFSRLQSTPIITKGSTYNGVLADALAAPAICWDGSQWVLTASIWNISGAKWHSVFFTATDLAGPWAYVANSLLSPSGGDYILGNSGLAWFDGKYWIAFAHYPVTPSGITLKWSTDLLSWNTVADPLSFEAVGADPALNVSKDGTKLELWYLDITHDTHLADTATPATAGSWVDQGVLHEVPDPSLFNYGEPYVHYKNSSVHRYLSYDRSVVDGERSIGMVRGPASASVQLDELGVVLGPSLTNAWEDTCVFDSCCVEANRGDGRGLITWMIYAGADIPSTTDNTNSSLGLAYWTH